MKNILNVVSIFGREIEWELDTALFWLFIAQAVLVLFMVIVFAVLLHRVGKAKSSSTVIVQSVAATNDEQEKPTEEPVKETPAEEPAIAPQEPTEEPIEETPAEESAEETPEEAPAEEEPAEETPEETPTEEPAEETPEETPEEEPVEEPTEETPAEEPAEEAPAEEEPAEEPAEETPAEEPVEEAPAEEVAADEAQANVIVIALPEEASEEPAPQTPAPARENDDVYIGGNVRYDKSFAARIIQADDDIKQWYGELKNNMLSYKKVHDRISWKRENFYIGRQKVATIAFRGLTLCLYLPLDVEALADSKYKVEPIEDNASFEDTPCLYRIKNAKRTRYAKDLIAMVMQNNETEQTDREDVDYYLPYESTEELLDKGLVKRNVRSKKDEAFFSNGSAD